MSLRKALLAFLVVAAVCPAWGAAEPLGSVTSTRAASIRDTNLTVGSAIFSGDVISVAAKGSALLALTSGAQAEILSNSSVSLTKTADSIQMTVGHGQASFHTSGENGVSALVADATVRPLNGSETSAIIQSLSKTHAIVAAQKGALLVTTAHDGKTYTLLEGQAADLTAAADPQQNGGAAPAGRAAPSVNHRSKKAAFWTIAIVGGGASITAYLLSRDNPKQSTTTLQIEVSPHTLD